VALKDYGSRFANRVAEEYVFVASGGGNGVYSLAPPINRLRDDNRADRSPSQDPAPVFSLQLLDQNLFQALTQEAFRHSGVELSGGQRRCPMFCCGPAA
jgi:hypothetical protein